MSGNPNFIELTSQLKALYEDRSEDQSNMIILVVLGLKIIEFQLGRLFIDL